MKPLTPTLLVLLALLWGCDSGDPEETATLGGRYSGGDAVEFATSSGNVFISFDIELELDAPGESGAFAGTVTFDRGAIENADPLTATGVVSGTLTGSTITFSAIASNFGSRHGTGRVRGDGLRLDAGGTLQSDGALTLDAIILDFAYGRSESFGLVLEK